MIKKNYKGRCERRALGKCKEVCRTYNAVQSAYADVLQNREDIIEINCNVYLDHFPCGEYTSDFVCVKSDRELLVRECVFRKCLTKPMMIRLLDESRKYWLSRGVGDWGIVIDEQ